MKDACLSLHLIRFWVCCQTASVSSDGVELRSILRAVGAAVPELDSEQCGLGTCMVV